MMSRHRFALVALVALALPLLAAEQSFAQWRFGFGRGGWRGGYYDGWGYTSPWYGSYYSGYYSPWYGSYNSYYPYSSNYTYTYPYSSYYTYPSSYTYSYPYYYNSGYTLSPMVQTYSTPTTSSNAYVSGTNRAGTATQSFYPPNAQGNQPAFIEVQVPADAQIWFDGESTSQGGTARSFRSPPLEQGQNYSYEVKARWNDNGKDIERTRKVRVRAGERVNVNFMANEEEGVGTPKQSGSEGTETTPRPAPGSEGSGTTTRPPGSGS
jgi:uncharacterized protein (TIGR03000 family)